MQLDTAVPELHGLCLYNRTTPLTFPEVPLLPGQIQPEKTQSYYNNNFIDHLITSTTSIAQKIFLRFGLFQVAYNESPHRAPKFAQIRRTPI